MNCDLRSNNLLHGAYQALLIVCILGSVAVLVSVIKVIINISLFMTSEYLNVKIFQKFVVTGSTQMTRRRLQTKTHYQYVR